MTDFIDGFVFPISKVHIDKYQQIAQTVAEIWKEHGAISYFEYISDDLNFDGTRSFTEFVETKDDEVVVFGWIVFSSPESRDQIHNLVQKDLRMTELVAPLMDPSKLIFDAKRMVYGGFRPLVQAS